RSRNRGGAAARRRSTRAGRRVQSARRSHLARACRRAGRTRRRTRADRESVVSTPPQGGRVMNRREFLETFAAAAVLPALGRQQPPQEWGSPVFALHLHLLTQPAAY